MNVKAVNAGKSPVITDFDAADYLRTEEDIAAYLNAVLEENDFGALAHALGVVARARGMAEVAKDAGMTREALYKALRLNSVPRFSTMQLVANAVGVTLVVVPKSRPKRAKTPRQAAPLSARPTSVRRAAGRT